MASSRTVHHLIDDQLCFQCVAAPDNAAVGICVSHTTDTRRPPRDAVRTDLETAWALKSRGVKYNVVSVLGGQSSGKSALHRSPAKARVSRAEQSAVLSRHAAQHALWHGFRRYGLANWPATNNQRYGMAQHRVGSASAGSFQVSYVFAGIWLGMDAEHGMLVVDVEGTDSAERGIAGDVR
jgi:hypothetical protein